MEGDQVWPPDCILGARRDGPELDPRSPPATEGKDRACFRPNHIWLQAMAEFPAMPLWTDAYLADTGHLTTFEHGAYFLLLVTAWRAGGYLPDDDVKLARYARMTRSQWTKTGPTLRAFFNVEGDQLVQGRLIDMLNVVRSRSKSASNSARAKYRKTNNQAHAFAQETQSERSANALLTKTISKTKEDISSLREDSPKRAFDLYNETMPLVGWPRALKLTEPRRRSLAGRLDDCGGLDGWREALAKARGSPFLAGENDRGWKADLDFLLKPRNFTKIMEGSYEQSPGKQSRDPRTSFLNRLAQIAHSGNGNGQRPPDAHGGLLDYAGPARPDTAGERSDGAATGERRTGNPTDRA